MRREAASRLCFANARRALSASRYVAHGNVQVRQDSIYLFLRLEFLGFTHELARQMRREQLDEFIHVGPQKRTAAKTDPSRMAFEQMRGVQHCKIGVADWVDRDARDDADAEADAHVGLDDVRIARRERDIEYQSRGFEQRRQRRTPRETEYVGDDRIFRELLERQLAALAQRMSARHDDGAVPAIDGQAHEVRE